MTKEIMLQCLRDARWVYVEYDREAIEAAEAFYEKSKGAYARPGLTQIAAALYQAKMTRLAGGE